MRRGRGFGIGRYAGTFVLGAAVLSWLLLGAVAQAVDLTPVEDGGLVKLARQAGAPQPAEAAQPGGGAQAVNRAQRGDGAAPDLSQFDHLATGFPLDGEHLNLRCEQCHLHGVFRGTPRQCSTCHIQGNPLSAMFMPAKHIPTPEPCNSCHTTNSFQNTHFSHASVMPGTCAQCHNNVNAAGKGPQHLVTSASCDQCHTTVSFATSLASFPK